MYPYIIIIIIITIGKAMCRHWSNYFGLTNLCFCLNKWHYKVLLIHLLRVPSLKIYKFIYPRGLKYKQNLVKSHSWISKWISNQILTYKTTKY